MDMIEAMETYGGGFVKALAVCFRRADPDNRRRLVAAFPEYITHYSGLAARMNYPDEIEPDEMSERGCGDR